MSDSVLSAIIGASIAIIGLIVAKESKTSEFRQQWIDGLRNDLAILISSALDYSKDESVAKAANESTARLRLRLNPKEEPSKVLLKSILQLHDSVMDTDARKAVRSAANEVVSTAQPVLKAEWRRVKRGEARYLTVLIIAILSLLISGGMLISPWLQHTSQISESGDYEVIERTQKDVPNFEAEGTHTEVNYVLLNDGHKFYATCDTKDLDHLDPTATCSFRPLRKYPCRLGQSGDKAQSDLQCKDADGHNVYLYVSKKE